jgi:FkbM family methyltransferase
MNLKLNKVKTNIGISLYLDPLDSLALSYNRIYEPKETFLIQKTVKQGMRILDIGANIGYYTTIFSKFAGNGGINAFEPDVQNFKILQRNCELNQCKNVNLHNVAIGNCNSQQKLYLSNKNHGDHRSYPTENYRDFIEIKMVSVDHYLKSEPNIDFIKMDIQGFEMSALEGMKNTLLKFKPILLLEIWPEALINNKTDPKYMIAFIRNLGYTIFDIENLNASITIEATPRWINSINNHTNIFCIYKN